MIKADSEADETNLASISESKQSEKKLVSAEVAATTNELIKDETEEEVDFKIPEKFKGTDTEALAKSIDLKQFSGQTGFESETEGMSNADLIAIQNQNAAVLAAAKAESASLDMVTEKPNVVMLDNKVIKGGDTVANTNISQTPMRIENTETTARALNHYLYGTA